MASLVVVNVRIPRRKSTHKGKAVAVSTSLAIILGIVRRGDPAEQLELQFQPDAITLHLKPAVPSGTPAYVICINVSHILVWPNLQKNQLVISNKVQVPPIETVNMRELTWECHWQVKDHGKVSRDGDSFGRLLRTAADYDLNFAEDRYLYARRYLKRLFQHYKAGRLTFHRLSNEISSLKFDQTLKRLRRRQLSELWEEALKYNQSYAHRNLNIRWLLYLRLGVLFDTSLDSTFSNKDIKLIAQSIIKRKSEWELEELLGNKNLVSRFDWSEVHEYIKKIRAANYLNSSTLCSIMLDKFDDHYKLDWIRSDIIAMIVLSSSFRFVNSMAVQKLLDFYAKHWPEDISEDWLQLFLSTVKLFAVRIDFDEWQGCGYFTLYLWTLYAKLPQYFLQANWNVFREAESFPQNPYSDLKDSMLELAYIVPCLRVDPLPSNPDHLEILLSEAIGRFCSVVAKFWQMENALFAKESMRNFVKALDYWLQVTEFCDKLMLIEGSADSARLTRTGRIAHSLASKVMDVFLHVVRLQTATPFSSAVVLATLSKLRLARLVFLLVWTGEAELPSAPADLLCLVKSDLYCFAHAIWATRFDNSERASFLMTNAARAMERDRDEAELFLRTYNSLGARVKIPCKAHSNVKPRSLRWMAPLVLINGHASTDSALAMLRIYLLLKFDIPFSATRSGISLMAADSMAPHEYSSTLNFWLERHCALTCRGVKRRSIQRLSPSCKPAYSIVIDGLEERIDFE